MEVLSFMKSQRVHIMFRKRFGDFYLPSIKLKAEDHQVVNTQAVEEAIATEVKNKKIASRKIVSMTSGKKNNPVKRKKLDVDQLIK